jgi:hypothetical protein
VQKKKKITYIVCGFTAIGLPPAVHLDIWEVDKWLTVNVTVVAKSVPKYIILKIL